MNKAHFLFVLLSIFLFSCKNNEDSVSKKTTGKINSISIVIEDQLWNGEIGDSLRNKFASPVLGLPQEEPLFNINQYSTKLLEGFMTDSRNIIVVKKKDVNKFEIITDQYASPQNVFHISGRTATDILAILEKQSPIIVATIRQTEIEECQKTIRRSALNPKIIENKFHIGLDVPIGYKYMSHESNFLWLKKEIVSGSSSLLIYQVPIYQIINKNNLISNIISMRDSIGKLYIHGKEPNTDMVTEEAYSPYFFKIKLDGKIAYEMKGTWELKNDFMTGPFINYVIIDQEYSRALVLEGFCYSPSKEKRDIMHELESIIKSVAIVKR
ncbi:DUF4837 family protein [Flavobacterium algicola]|uniref:DUF4837 family protein n=1 Tax=Flavobacterium algicola TaxID=556529 RepID=UPI001EFE09E6|nr:DUF4837 family protein [Flavobacterium algicola]MCG9791994.1 DUF4837 family protein [Flavobacterium algicola]